MRTLDTVLDRILIELLSDRIVERMKARATSALVLVAGTDLGLEPALEQLQALHGAGWSFDVALAPEARAFVGDRLATFRPAEGSAEGSAGGLLGRCGLVLVPALSLSLAAKVALGIADDPLSTLLQGALERGIRIVAARDGVCPNARDRRARGLLPPPAYRRMMGGHLETLAGYGIELCWAARLAAAVTQAPATPDIAAPAPTAGVFGLSAARGVAGGELRLGRGVLVTPAAAEELRARGIRLVRE